MQSLFGVVLFFVINRQKSEKTHDDTELAGQTFSSMGNRDSPDSNKLSWAKCLTYREKAELIITLKPRDISAILSGNYD